MDESETQNILIVDDDLATRNFIAETLHLEGYRVETAADGAGALSILDGWHPCLVLLDARMPVLDGLGVVEALRRKRIDVQVVLMTAANEGRAWAEQIAAAAYLAKPFDLDDLLSVVARLCPLTVD